MLTAEQKQKFIDFYSPKLGDGEFTTTFALLKEGQWHFFNGLNTTYIILGFGKHFSSFEEAKKDSEAIIITPKKLFKELFPDQFNKVFDKRTLDYFETYKKNIGLINTKHGYKGEAFETKFSYRIWANLTGSGAVEIGQLQDGTWVAEYSYRCGIDDYVIVDLYFRKKPLKKDILIVNLIDKIEDYFNLNGWHNVTFECWECGSLVHWLDIPGFLEEKWEHFKEKYCNLC